MHCRHCFTQPFLLVLIVCQGLRDLFSSKLSRLARPHLLTSLICSGMPVEIWVKNDKLIRYCNNPLVQYIERPSSALSRSSSSTKLSLEPAQGQLGWTCKQSKALLYFVGAHVIMSLVCWFQELLSLPAHLRVEQRCMETSLPGLMIAGAY